MPVSHADATHSTASSVARGVVVSARTHRRSTLCKPRSVPIQEPEPEDPVWDDIGGISDVQASLVRLDIGRPRRK